MIPFFIPPPVPPVPAESQPTENPNDWSFAMYLFGQALVLVLQESTGVVVNLKEGVNFPNNPEAKKAIVYRVGEAVHVDPTNNDWEEGTIVKMKKENGQTAD